MSEYRALAAAVLIRALKDCYGAVERQRQDAQRFLCATNPTLQFYCDGLDLDPEAFVDATRKNGPAWAARFTRPKEDPWLRGQTPPSALGGSSP